MNVNWWRSGGVMVRLIALELESETICWNKSDTFHDGFFVRFLKPNS